ncbi:MAG: hypothetical protein COB02_15860 [Candidatus Cloacimonadota bacterium]|nr:MAG: hypothetical protein COB02_15860 [Candidatus Cloacimonadota bacterium]
MSFKNQNILSFLLLLFVLILGTSGYMVIEGYSFLDGLYMCVITITTVGFGEVKPLSEYGRLFTVLLIMLGFFSMAWLGRTFIEAIFEGVSQGRSGKKKMENIISKLSNHYILCGFGRVGIAAAEYLESQNVDFVVIDSFLNPETKEELINGKYVYIHGDATQDSSLIEAGIKRASGVLALLNSDPDNLFLVLTARELNPTLKIFSRSEDDRAEHKILKAGADKVITPSKSAGKFIAGALLNACGKDVKVEKLVEEVTHQWYQINENSKLIGKTILEGREILSSKIVGLRRDEVDSLVPAKTTIIKENDSLLILGVPQEKKVASHSKQVAIIDDNPIVVRLYTRLFQKKGLIPISASDGIKGAELVLKENPPVAVIDYLLPGMTGIEVCRKIKLDKKNTTKLILFTGTEDDEARQEALEAGADLVIIKSSDTKEIINAVIGLQENSD